jgi:peptidyl-prolyl cis-trans isomerase D
MMRTLRKKTRIVLFIALAGFALLIFFQWGLNVTGTRTSPTTNIAKIDGVPISYVDYYRFAQAKEMEYKGITPDEIWSLLIDEIMWRRLVKEEKIRVTDKEIWAIIQNNPPREIYESEFMQDENGEFDFNKYYELLRAPQSRQWLLEYEYNLRTQLPKEKVRSLISTMGWVSPFEDSLTLAMQTTTYDLSFFVVPLFRLSNYVDVSEEEIIQYYNNNIDELKIPQSTILKYVFFEKKPSDYDTLEARERMEDFIARINEGEDFLTVAREVSNDTIIEIPVQHEVDLKPYLMNVYKNLSNGDVSDIIEGPDGFEVIKRVRRGLVYRVKTNITVSPITLDEIRNRIESFKEIAQSSSFDTAAAELNLLVRTTQPLRENQVSFPVRNAAALAEFLKGARHGTIGGPFSSLGGYYLFTLDSIIPTRIPPVEDVRSRIEMTIAQGKMENQLQLYLDDLGNRLRSGVTMEEIAASDTIVQFRTDTKDVTLNQIRQGYMDEFAGMVAALEPQEISPPLIAGGAGFIIRCDNKAVSSPDTTVVQLLQVKRQMRLQQLTQSLFTPEKIEDNRDMFFE